MEENGKTAAAPPGPSAEKIARALTIAGSDSGGCAGIQADLRTFSALGVHGATVITALTAQNTVAVLSSYPVPAEFVGLQIDAVMTDIGADAAKTGMLAEQGTIEMVADRVRTYGLRKLVVDPVMVATSGARLIREEAVESMVRSLFPAALLVTPNLSEAEALVRGPVATAGQVEEAARKIHAWGPQAVLIKGGHGDDPEQVVDTLFDGTRFVRFAARRIPTPNTHGSGCTLAAAITAFLAKGFGLEAAVAEAKQFVTAALIHSYSLGAGSGPLGHFLARDRELP